MVSQYFGSQASSEQQGGVATARIATGDVANPMIEQDDERFRFRWIPEPIRDIGSGLGRVWSELDRPISERLGFEIPEMRGPVDEIGNFLLEEGTRLTNVGFALPGVGAGTVLARAATKAPRMAKPFIRGARWATEPLGGYGMTLPARIAAETGVTMGAGGLARAADEGIPENVQGWRRTSLLLGAGLAGGVLGAGGVVGGLRAAGRGIDDTAANIMKATDRADSIASTPQGRQAIFQVVFDDLENPSRRLPADARGNKRDLKAHREALLSRANVGPAQRKWLEFQIEKYDKEISSRWNPKTEQWEHRSMEDVLHDFDATADADPLSATGRARAAYVNTFDDGWLSSTFDDTNPNKYQLLEYQQLAKDTAEEIDNTTLSNYLEIKDLRGPRSEIEEALQIGEDENLMRAISLDNAVRERLVADGVEGFKQNTRDNLNPILRYMNKLGLYKLDGYASELVSKYFHNARAGDNWRNGKMALIRSMWNNYKMPDIVEIGPEGMRFKEGHVPKIENGRYLLTTEGATLPFTKQRWNETLKRMEEVDVDKAMTTEQLQVLETVIRTLSDLQRAEIGAGINPALVGRKAGRLAQQGRRATQSEIAAAEVEVKRAQDVATAEAEFADYGWFDPRGDESIPKYETDLARELADFDLANEVIPQLNDVNPLFGDVLELAEWNTGTNRLLDDRGGYIPRKIQGKNVKEALIQKRQNLDVDTEFTQQRVGQVSWKHDNPMEASMDEMYKIMDLTEDPRADIAKTMYEGDILSIIDERLAAGLNRINDEWLSREITTSGRTKTELMAQYTPTLAYKRRRIAAKASYLTSMTRRSSIRADVYSRAPSELKRQEKELKETLDKVTARLAQLADSRREVDLDRLEANLTGLVGQTTEGGTFRAQTAVEITELINQHAQIMRQVLQAENQIDALEQFIKNNKAEYAQYGRRLGGIKSTLKGFREGTTNRQGMVELQEEFDTFLKRALGEGWAFGPTTEGGTHLDPAVWQITTSSPIRNAQGEIIMNPSGGSRTATDFYNRQGIPESRVVTPEEFLEAILPVMNEVVTSTNPSGRLRDPSDLRRNITPKELDKQFKSMFKKRMYQEQAINRMLNRVEEFTLVRDNIMQKVVDDGDQVARLESYLAGVTARERTEAGASMERIKNLFDSGVQKERLTMANRMLKKNSTLRQAWETMGEKEARRAENYARQLDEIRAEKVVLDERYEREFNNTVNEKLLSQIPNISNRLGGQRYFNEAFAAEIAQGIAPVQMGGAIGATIDGLNAFNNMMRPVMATLDASAMGIQGLLALGTNPIQAAQAFTIATRSVLGNNKLWDDFVTSNYSERALGERSIEAYVRKGGYWSPEESFGEFLINDKITENIVFNKIPLLKKGATKSNMHFSRTGNMLRFMLYRNAVDNGQTMKMIASGGKRQSLTDKQERELIQTINEATGWKNASPTSLEESLLFAPRFFRSQISMLGKGMKGTSPESQLAREMFVRTLALGSTFTYMMNEMRGEQTDLRPIKYDINGNPYYNTNFMRIRNVGGTDISVFGPWDTMASMITQLFTEGWAALSKRTLEFKASPSSSFLNDLRRGYNFEGEPTRAFGDPKQTIQSVWANGRGFLPFSTQDMLDPIGNKTPLTATPIFNFLGVKATPTTASERRDYSAAEWVAALDPAGRAEFGMEPDEIYAQYDQLTGTAQQRFDELFPEHKENIELNKKKFEIRGEAGVLASLQRGDIRANRMDEIEAVWTHYKTGQHPVQTISQVLERISEINRETSVRYQQLDETLDTEITNPDLSDPNQRAISEFYALYDQAEIANTGIMDWIKYDVLSAQFMAGLTEEQRAYVENRRVSQYPPELQPYIEAKSRVAQSGFYSLGDEVYRQNRRIVARYLNAAGYPVPDSSWSSFDALFTAMKSTHPQIAADLNNAHYIRMNGEVTALKDRVLATNGALKKDLELIGRRTPEQYSLINQRIQRFR